MSKYDKSIEISHEEEGTYHRREVEPVHYTSKPVTTYHTERYLVEDDSRPVVKHKSSSSKLGKQLAEYTSDEADNFEEWTTSKKKVNHKTRQVETRVSRQLLVENGKVIADSGPQVTTRIKEDNKVEECEKEKTPKNKSKFEALENAPEGPEGSCSGRVLGEKKEIQRVSREVREENMQYHDERFKELTGRDVHQKAIKAPHELITINDKHHSSDSAPRGKMVHYSNKGKKYKDTDEILEVAKLAIDGSITKEVKRTHNHEEFSEDEKPDETGEAEELRQKPIVQRSSRRHVDYVNDYDDLRTPDASDNDEREEYDSRGRPIVRSKAASGQRLTSATSGGRRSGSGASSRQRTRHHQDHDDDEAFPRYDLDPLLNSLRDEDYKPASSNEYRPSHQNGSGTRHGAHVKEHSLERGHRPHRAGSVSSSDEEEIVTRRSEAHHQRHHSPASTGHHHQAQTVEIPEEYRVNRQRLLASKSGGSRERVHSKSPIRSSSRASYKQSHGRNQRKEDAAVQAHLTDEEIERQSLASSISGGAKTQAKTAQHLQRQSTPNASRRYYYGNAATANSKTNTKANTGSRRRASISSSSSSSLSSLNDHRNKQRQQGVRSRDSGFRSPHSTTRTETPLSEHKRQEQQIYSVSSKAKSAHNNNKYGEREHGGATSPTLTTGSAGQRSVKTTTTTMSAGLADRPLSRSGRSGAAKERGKADKLATSKHDDDDYYDEHKPVKRSRVASEGRGSQLDSISVSSLNGPNATKIKVPYRHVIEIQRVGTTQATNAATSTSGDNNEVSRDRQAETNEEATSSRRGQQRNDTKVGAISVDKSSSEMSFQEDIESLSKRLASISQIDVNEGLNGTDNKQADRKHFDYKTVVANIQSVPAPSRQVVGTYNVRLEQNSPFQQRILIKNSPEMPPEITSSENNNETGANLNEYYVKYRATPVLVDESVLLTNKRTSDMEDDLDRMSQSSSCSLQSSRTYKIRTIAQPDNDDAQQNQSQTHNAELTNDRDNEQQLDNEVEFDENGNSKRPAAWIFDPRDGSTTAIVPPKRPETPKVDSKTEELVQSRGGRSYYLEILDRPTAGDKTPAAGGSPSKRPGSMDSLYSRWNSQGALNTSSAASSASPITKANFSYRPLTTANGLRAPSTIHRSTKQLNSAIAQHEQNRNKLSDQQQQLPNRRQLPFGGPPSVLGDKSKSSSCLLTVTKPSKYSIYGGFRKPDEPSKPVPRLSYSRAIGPRSQRVDSLPKTPSRYLKMR